MAELILLPGAAMKMLPRYDQKRSAAALVALLDAGNVNAATSWWRAHVGRADTSMRKRGVARDMRVAVISEYTSLVRFEILCHRCGPAQRVVDGGGDAR